MSGYTSKGVARVAGVSQSTVSYVMSGKRPISERTRQRVMEAIETLTYQPNAGARALASRRASVIGLVLPFGAVVDTVALVPFIETITSSSMWHQWPRGQCHPGRHHRYRHSRLVRRTTF